MSLLTGLPHCLQHKIWSTYFSEHVLPSMYDYATMQWAKKCKRFMKKYLLLYHPGAFSSFKNRDKCKWVGKIRIKYMCPKGLEEALTRELQDWNAEFEALKSGIESYHESICRGRKELVFECLTFVVTEERCYFRDDHDQVSNIMCKLDGLEFATRGNKNVIPWFIYVP